jgi:hypothetical protein
MKKLVLSVLFLLLTTNTVLAGDYITENYDGVIIKSSDNNIYKVTNSYDLYTTRYWYKLDDIIFVDNKLINLDNNESAEVIIIK